MNIFSPSGTQRGMTTANKEHLKKQQHLTRHITYRRKEPTLNQEQLRRNEKSIRTFNGNHQAIRNRSSEAKNQPEAGQGRSIVNQELRDELRKKPTDS